MYNIYKFKKDLKKTVSEKRYEHSIFVATHARKLAELYGVDEEKAYVAGLLHDIAKEFSVDENREWVEKYNLSKELLKDDYLEIIHANIGAVVVKKWYNLDDEICNAICYHTIGNVPFTLFEKIIFISDKIGKKRNIQVFEEIKNLAYNFKIDDAIIMFLESEKKYLAAKDIQMESITLELLETLKKEVKEKKVT